MPAAQNNRRADLAKIHLAAKQLGLDDDAYRDVMFSVCQVRSAAELSYEGRAKLLAHFERCGFKPASTGKRAGRPVPAPDRVGQVKRIRAQLISLGRLPDSYADGIAKQMFGVEKYEWCLPDQLQAISAALGYQQRKKGAPTA